jgi:DNA polymerase-3 subunit alpha
MENGLSEAVAKEVWGSLITAGSYAFNSAHCCAYGMLAWWCMYIKRHHSLEFFMAALEKLPEAKRQSILKDAVRHGVEILPPDPELSMESWAVEDGAIRAGFSQIPGVGAKTARVVVETREREGGWSSWPEMLSVKGIGPKTLERIMEFVQQDDPFEIMLLRRRVDAVIAAIDDGEIDVPRPTHTSLEVPYARTGKDVRVVWAGEITDRNLRDLFEVNLSRTGIPLNPDEVKAPDKAEWLIMRARDDEEQMMLTIDRWKYPRMKAQAWSIRPEHDIVVVEGVKRGNQSARRIYIDRMWVVDPEDD